MVDNFTHYYLIVESFWFFLESKLILEQNPFLIFLNPLGNQNCNLLKKLIIYNVNDLTIISAGWIREPKITLFFISLISSIFKIMLGDSHQTYLKKKKNQNNTKKKKTLQPLNTHHHTNNKRVNQPNAIPTSSTINPYPPPTSHIAPCPNWQPTNSCTKPPVFTLITTWPNSQQKCMLSNKIRWRKIIHMTYPD